QNAYALTHPGFQVNVFNAPDSGPQVQKWIASIPSDTEPDFSLLQAVDAVTLGEAPNSNLVDLTDFITNDIGIDKFYHPNIIEVSKSQPSGKIFTVPWNLGFLFMYVNTKILDQYGLKPPTSWDDFEQVAQKVHNPPNVYAFGTEFATAGSGGSDFFF